MKRINATHRKLLRILREGMVDSTASLSQISGIHFGVVLSSMSTLIKQGYVRRTSKGFSSTAKGRMLADSVADIKHRRPPTRKAP